MTIRAEALARTQALALGVIRNVTGYSIADHQNARVVERIVKIYEQELASLRRGASGSRMKPETKQIMQMDVGDVIEIPASCKANLAGQMKTVRRVLSNDALKWRIEQTGPTQWRVQRRPDGSYNRGKDANRNMKAMFLAGCPVSEGWKLFEGIYKPNQICNDFTKNKARDILNNPNAEWTSKTLSGGRVVVRRTK